MKTIPFLIQKDSRGRSLKPIDPSQPLYQETWLQDLLGSRGRSHVEKGTRKNLVCQYFSRNQPLSTDAENSLFNETFEGLVMLLNARDLIQIEAINS